MGTYMYLIKMEMAHKQKGIDCFNNYDDSTFQEVVDNVIELDIETYCIKKDLRLDRNNEYWFNVILKKSNS